MSARAIFGKISKHHATHSRGSCLATTSSLQYILVRLEDYRNLKRRLKNKEKIRSRLESSERMWRQEYDCLKKELDRAHFEKEYSGGQCNRIGSNTSQSSASLHSISPRTTLKHQHDIEALEEDLSDREISLNR